MGVAVLASGTVLSARLKVFTVQRPATVSCQLPSGTAAFSGQGFVLCDGQRLHLTLPFFALFSFLFRDRSRRKEALVSRAQA